jgi:hypothetical protein
VEKQSRRHGCLNTECAVTILPHNLPLSVTVAHLHAASAWAGCWLGLLVTLGAGGEGLEG